MAALSLLLAVVLGLGAAYGPVVMEAVDLLDDLRAGHGPSTWKRERPPPVVSAIQWTGDGGQVRTGDLYTPGDGAGAALVLVPGLTPEGKDDPQLVAFAMTLARAGFAALVPEIPGLRRLEVGPGDVDLLADSIFRLRRDQPESRPLGVAAVSFAAGPAIAAIAGPGKGAGVDFVIAIGGYHSLEAAIAFATTGCFRRHDGDPWRCRSPNDYGKWVFAASNAGRIGDPADRTSIRAMAGRKLKNPEADISDLTERLGVEGAAIYALLANRDPDLVAGMVAGLPEAIRHDMAAIDPSAMDLKGIEASFVLIHGRDDPLIPESESQALADAVGPGRGQLYLPGGLSHVSLGETPGLRDGLILIRAAMRVLEFTRARTNG